MKKRILPVITLFTVLFVSNSAMAEGKLSIGLGYEQTSGDYGQVDETEITSMPLYFQYIRDAWRFKLSIPYISVTGDGSVIPSGGGMGGMGSFGGTGGSVVETESGLGDVTGSLSRSFRPKNSYMFYELTAAVKLGTASPEKNLGSGENDYSLSLYSAYGKHNLKPFLSVGYQFMGDIATVDYNDVIFAKAGLMYQINAKTLMNMSYDYQQATVDGGDDGKSLSLSVSRKLNQKWLANVYLVNGLSDSVADSGIGFSLIRGF